MTKFKRNLAIVGIAVIAILSAALSANAEPFVYVPMGGDGKINVIDTATDKIVSTFEGLEAVHGLAGTPDGQFLIAGSFTERSIGETPSKPTGVTEDEHAAHHKIPEAKSQKSDAVSISTVSVVRVDSGKIVRAIDVPGAVHHVTVSTDGQYAVVVRPNENEISVIDLKSFDVVGNIATGELPNYSVFSPDDTRLFVSNAGDNTISVINAGTWTLETTIDVGASPEHIVLSNDGKILYVNNVDDGSVSVVDTESKQTVKTIKVASTLHGIDLSEDGTALFVAARDDDKLAKINLSSGLVQTVTLAPSPYHVAAITGTRKIYVSSSDEDKIWAISQQDLGVLRQILIGGKGHQMVQMSGS